MKNKAIALLFIGVFLLAFSTCKKDTDVNMDTFKIVKEVEKVTTGTTTATITGMYEYSGRIDGIKVRVGTSEQLFGSDVFVAEVSGKAYSVNITGLRSGTLYHYRYEVDYGAKEDYLTEVYDFTTQSESPTVKTLEVQAIDSTTFRVKCVVDADGGSEVTERGICFNTYGDPILDDETMQHTSGGMGQYTIRMENLPTNTKYYVRAYAKNGTGIGFGEVLDFKTGGETTKPQVSTVEVSNVTYNAATCLCNVSSDGGLELYERGVCWGLELNPIQKVPAEGTEIGNYTVTIEGLDPNTDYHVRAYAINEKGIAYGEDLPFRTTDGKPTVTTSGITEITSTSAKCGGNVTDQGADPVTERGICWSTSHEPMATGNHATNGTGTGSFICDMTNLTPNQTYYVRAYATNSKGTAYGDEVDFMAMEGLPSVETVDVTNVTTSGAKVNYKVTIEGGLEVVEHGVCWSESNTIPTIIDHYVSGGNGTGTFSVDLSGLNPGTKYYVRAYAKNEQGGEAYGTAKDFTTEATLPTVTTDGIEGTTAHGTVTADGGKPVTERGICWGLNHNPTTADLHNSNGTGLGSFAVPLTDLQPGKTYYYRAYATNEMGTAYGLEGPPLVVEANLPTVTTGEVTNIGQNSAQGSGNVTDDGGADVTERGVCWSTSRNPTVDGSHNTSGTGTGSFTVNMTGLTANTKYYVRAYAKNSAGISYGNEVDFRTSQNISAPTVTTAPVTDIHQTTATGGGNVTSDGGANVTERGICWSTSHNPTTSNSHASNGTGTGAFEVNITGLTPGTTYYVRAYAINSAGTSYGNEVYFTTGAQTYTISVSASPSNGGSAHVGSTTGPTTGTYNQGQSCTVYAVANSGYYFANWTENGSVVSSSANYTFTVNGNRTLRANFTQIVIPTVTTNDVTNIQQTTATGGGNVTNSGGATVTARGVCWSTSTNPTISNSHTTNGTGTGSFTSSMTGLTPGTLYHVRAYATNSAGTGYGPDVSFTTLSSGGNVPQGAINGLFTINANGDQVYFSQGNLQYQASTNTWRFATNQYDYIGDANSNISQNYSGWIDLFGWGTSGNNHGAVCYQPWSTSQTNSDYYAYGQSTYNLYDQTGQADWGYNAISNGGNTTNTWRTLTGGSNGEWRYIFETRSTPSGIRYAKAQVNGVKGVVLLPDDWSASYYSLSNTNQAGASFGSNVISSTQWSTLEQHGAVFLPAAGGRSGTSVSVVGSYGIYWSASYSNSSSAYSVYFHGSNLNPQSSSNRYDGFSVRLVRVAQ
jgi:hypothetical protein